VSLGNSIPIGGQVGVANGVATISRLLKIVGLFCRIQSLLQGSFAKQIYNFKEPTNGSHPIVYIRGIRGIHYSILVEYIQIAHIHFVYTSVYFVYTNRIYEYSFSSCYEEHAGGAAADTPSFKNCRSLLQNTVSFIGLFCKRDLMLILLVSRGVLIWSVIQFS